MKNLLTFVGMLACVLFSLSAFGQNITIPDASFKYGLVNTICADIGDGIVNSDVDTDNDGEVSVAEALAVTQLYTSSLFISSLEGIQYFTNLLRLDCYYNQLTSLNVQGLTNLQYLDCGRNQLASLNVQGLTNLQYLSCGQNQLTNLDVQGLTNLQSLICTINQLSSLDVQGLTNLQKLYCGINPLSTLNVQGLTNLQYLGCWNNQLSSLNVQGLTNLRELSCSGNQLTTLNVQGLTNLQYLGCWSNQLTTLNMQGLTNLQKLYCGSNQLPTLNAQGLTNLDSLDCGSNQLSTLNAQGLTNLQKLWCQNNQLASLLIKNGNSEYVNFSNNPNLTYICADQSELIAIQTKADQYGLTNCSVNSYCSYGNPEGGSYLLQGQNKWDTNNNSCDATDPVYPNLQFQITDGTNSGAFVSNTTGDYFIPLQAGNYTLTPQLENPNYFTVSPSSVTLNLPQDTLNLSQNFCIIPNGTHHDVEVTIIPITPTRPGFDATYQITYKNKGNQVESDSITFTFQDDRMDFISASIAPDAQRTNVLQWNYSNLQPLETRTITIVMNVNSPMETPAVNAGDILSFQAAIYLVTIDEMPTDNTHNLRQIVVGSFDPNDKTCLEGNEILPTQVGGYLHYLIRFENTGTYAAENIVVKDMIDVNKFDIATLQLTRASHECFTRINGNKVEFIFENINLPFTEPDKHGYVAFKIKTKPNLVLGDAVTNQADIFFDYNFPITTNVASTQVVSSIATNNAGQNDFDVIAQPNPTTNFIQFTTKVALQKAEVYDNLGRLVQTSGINNNQISIGSLASGVYFVKVLAKEGVSVQKVVKE